MIVYVETNFILEMAFLQEEHESCESILNYARDDKIDLVIPAFSIAEPYETWVRRRRGRSDLQTSLTRELREIARSASYSEIDSETSDIATLLVRSVEEDKRRLDEVLVEVLQASEIIPIDSDVVKSAINYQTSLGLSPQDSIVYASVMAHLQSAATNTKCFLNRNSKDFLNPDIQSELRKNGCRLVSSFSDGLALVKARLTEK
jgi:predicted nucleic acid-binding protein